MNIRTLIMLAFLFCAVFSLAAEEGTPTAVSPGNSHGVALVESRCPAFSWSGVAWAQKYRVVVFAVAEPGAGIDDETRQAVDDGLPAMPGADPEAHRKPVLSAEIAAGALSWTPSVSQGLAEGVDYAWCVGALDANGAWTWSELMRFRIDIGARQALGARDPAGLKEEKDGATADAAGYASAGKDAGKKDMPVDRASPMGTEGACSTFYGTGAGANNSSDYYDNSFFGSGAGYANTNGIYNTFMGFFAGYSNSTGNYNTFMGHSAGEANTIGGQNTFMGYDAGSYNTSGDYNTFIGSSAGVSNTTGNANTFLGNEAGAFNTIGDYNTFLGTRAGFHNIDGWHNTIIGRYAGHANTSGSYNTFLGNGSGEANTTGYRNIFIGGGAGQYNITGGDNTFLGHAAGHENTAGNRNVFLGYNAGFYEAGSDKLYIDSSDTTAPLIYGDFAANLVRVNGTLETTRTGSNNVLAVTRTDGASFKLSAMGASGQLGTVSSHPVNFMTNNVKRMTIAISGNVGIGVTVPAYPLHMASGAHCTAGGVWTNASSRALKENIVDLKAEEAVAALNELNPVRFTYKSDRADEQVGFIAEDVPELVATRDRKGMSAMDVVAVLTRVVQEQQKALAGLQAEIKMLKEAAQADK